MAISLPVSQQVIVTERRPYYIEYQLCPETPQSAIGDAWAKAFPYFAYPALHVGFFDGFIDGVGVKQGVDGYVFSPMSKLWKITGYRSGSLNGGPAESFPVATKISDLAAPSMPCSFSGKVLTVTVPFGASFSRNILDNGSYATSDMDAGNDPAKYFYVVYIGDTLVGRGWIDITLSPPTPPPPPATLTVCSVGVE